MLGGFSSYTMISSMASSHALEWYKFHVQKQINSECTLQLRVILYNKRIQTHKHVMLTSPQFPDSPIFPWSCIYPRQGAKQTLQMAPGFRKIVSGREVKMLCSACDWVMSWDGGFEKAPSNHAWFQLISINKIIIACQHCKKGVCFGMLST